ncbi:putative phage abortive infection protein [Flavobacterium sp. NRK1]|uniref:putative phage abortive infection protein n=1 Tax=Flavobacterium sp. NRK1 TaxID=2954929 RepID=UPI002093552C|nr:putative phage abortive infection protein [Flavobacterium sp. NRK1]MCO6146568.1 hypothetical protein [Flavobacterium sp. NRK1]
MKKEEKLILYIPFGIIIITLLAYIIKGHITFYDINFDKLDAFGGFIGGLVGTSLTIVATLYIYRTFHAQKEELASQKEELKIQKELIAQQQFETTFFNLFNIHLELKKNINYNTENSISKTNFESIVNGIQFFEFVHDDFRNVWKYEHNMSPSPIIKIHDIKEQMDNSDFSGLFFSDNITNEKLIQDIKFKYQILFQYYKNYLGPYFRNLYHLLKYINNNCPNNLSKKQYADVLQSQMSFSESVLLFYNSFEFDKMREQIKSFDFLENMHTSNLFELRHNNLSDLGKIKSD